MAASGGVSRPASHGSFPVLEAQARACEEGHQRDFPVSRVSERGRRGHGLAFSMLVRTHSGLMALTPLFPLTQMDSCRIQPPWGRLCNYLRWYISMTPLTTDLLLEGKRDVPAEHGAWDGRRLESVCMCACVLCICMYVYYMCVHLCVCAGVYAYMCMCVHAYACMCMCIWCICACVCILMHVCVCTCLHVYVQCVCVQVYMHVCVCACVCIHVYVFMCVYVCACVCACLHVRRGRASSSLGSEMEGRMQVRWA